MSYVTSQNLGAISNLNSPYSGLIWRNEAEAERIEIPCASLSGGSAAIEELSPVSPYRPVAVVRLDNQPDQHTKRASSGTAWGHGRPHSYDPSRPDPTDVPQ